MKRTKKIIGLLVMLVIILAAPVLQQTQEAITVYVNITNPYNYETFDYSDTSEEFTTVITIYGLTPNTAYWVTYNYYIDGVFLTASGGWKTSDGLGKIGVYYYYTVNPSSYSVGSHTFNANFQCEAKTGSDTHTWYRDSPPPTYTPTITFTTPVYDNTYYNYTASGTTFTPIWNLGDVDDNVDVMRLYLDGALQTTWNNPDKTVNPPYDSYFYGVTIDTEKTYTLVVNGTDDDSNFYEETIHVIGISTGGSISVTDPTSYYLGANPTFQIQTTDVNGLNNLIIYYDGNDDSIFDDDGTGVGNWYTSSEGWDWTTADGVTGSRTGGDMIIQDSVVGSYARVYIWHTNLYAYTEFAEINYYYEAFLKPTSDISKYKYFGFNMPIGGAYYACINLFVNGTIQSGVRTNAYAGYGTDTSISTGSLTFTQNEEYLFRIIVGSSWIAYQYSLGFGYVTVRNSTNDFSTYYTSPAYAQITVHNAAGQSNAYVNVNYLRTGRANWHDFIYYVYNSSAATTQINSQMISAADWLGIPAGIFYLNFTMYNDLGTKSSILLEKYKDTTAPSLLVTMPYNNSEWFVSEVPSLAYFVNWSENEGYANTLRFELNYNSSNKIDITWTLTNQIPDRFPACDRKIVDSFGTYYFRLTATDSAGNRNISSVIWFYVFNERNVAISCTSSYDGLIISQDYLLFFIDGIQYEYESLLVRTEEYHLEIKDIFMNSLYDNTIEIYNSIVSIEVPLRRVNFTNPNTAGCEYRIWQGVYSRAFIISTSINVSYYLYDGNYTLVAEAIDPHVQDNIQYIATSTIFRVYAGMGTVGITLNMFEEQEFKIYFICRSSYNTEIIDIETYLKIYVNDSFIDGYCAYVYSKSNFEVIITDVFGNVLYSGTIAYTALVTINLDLRLFTFTNKEQQTTSIIITQSGGTGELFFPMPLAGSRAIYLMDGTYSVEHKPSDPDKGEGEMWTSKSYSFDCSLATQQLDLWLGVFENVPPQFNFLANLQEYMLMLRNIILTSLGFQVGILFAAIFVLFMIAKRIPKID